MTRYADIVLPLYQPTYTFEVAEGCDLAVGDALTVSLADGSVRTQVLEILRNEEAGKA